MLIFLKCCHLAAMIERLQRHTMDCCATTVIYKNETRSHLGNAFTLECLLPPLVGLLQPSFSDKLEASRETQARWLTNLPKIRNRASGIRTQDLSTDRLLVTRLTKPPRPISANHQCDRHAIIKVLYVKETIANCIIIIIIMAEMAVV